MHKKPNFLLIFYRKLFIIYLYMANRIAFCRQGLGFKAPKLAVTELICAVAHIWDV